MLTLEAQTEGGRTCSHAAPLPLQSSIPSQALARRPLTDMSTSGFKGRRWEGWGGTAIPLYRGKQEGAAAWERLRGTAAGRDTHPCGSSTPRCHRQQPAPEAELARLSAGGRHRCKQPLSRFGNGAPRGRRALARPITLPAAS